MIDIIINKTDKAKLLHKIEAMVDSTPPPAGFDTNSYEQWSTGPPAQRIWWSYNFFSGPDNN